LKILTKIWLIQIKKEKEKTFMVYDILGVILKVSYVSLSYPSKNEVAFKITI
jgi:hypothetical protein